LADGSGLIYQGRVHTQPGCNICDVNTDFHVRGVYGVKSNSVINVATAGGIYVKGDTDCAPRKRLGLHEFLQFLPAQRTRMNCESLLFYCDFTRGAEDLDKASTRTGAIIPMGKINHGQNILRHIFLRTTHIEGGI
jgi:hypothetical protein